MTAISLDEVHEFIRDESRVTVTRSGSQWTGRIIATVDRPALILERDDGPRVVVVLEGVSVVSAVES